MTTVITHIYNEEFLLPYWLKHHREIFDHGIVVDYNSTDSSLEIVRELCPTWDIIPTINEFFDAYPLDAEIMGIESGVTGTRMCLNVTEFLCGDFDLVADIDEQFQILVPAVCLVDTQWDSKVLTEPLLSQAERAISYKDNFFYMRARSIHNFNVQYPLGRHFDSFSTEELFTVKLVYFPMNDKFVERKLQIQNKIGVDKGSDRGWEHHNYGQGLTIEILMDRWSEHISKSTPIDGDIMNIIIDSDRTV